MPRTVLRADAFRHRPDDDPLTAIPTGTARYRSGCGRGLRVRLLPPVTGADVALPALLPRQSEAARDHVGLPMPSRCRGPPR